MAALGGSTGEKNSLLCGVCGKRFSEKRNLNQHSLCHLGMRPHVPKVDDRIDFRADHSEDLIRRADHSIGINIIGALLIRVQNSDLRASQPMDYESRWSSMSQINSAMQQSILIDIHQQTGI
ncbi:hypothetical protein CEXT_91301 [Caerostris extrusa]|uniref:C2H2-type domain-containing protein n=1 Tax=Caerostris extrusa TaxID=172846 RepID=A0AAV4XZC0_CAEEX|nr:hypothetical protein CEXT_91301 [Caerostris extrusa]